MATRDYGDDIGTAGDKYNSKPAVGGTAEVVGTLLSPIGLMMVFLTWRALQSKR